MPTRFIYDGNTRKLTAEDVRIGHIVRMVDHEPVQDSPTPRAAIPAWSDCLIAKIDSEKSGAIMVHLVRPYMYAENTDTACPTWSVGFEQFKVDVFRLLDSKYQLVLMSTGEPAKMAR
jgi:hypothetical protein